MAKQGVSERASCVATNWAGSSTAFLLALAAVVAWIISGPFFGFSNTWQSMIDTGATVVTFLLVFLIQRSQNQMIGIRNALSIRARIGA